MHRARLLTFFLTVFLASINPAYAESSQRITLTGSSTLAPLISEVGLRYESKHPSVRVDVETGGSSRGIADTRRKVIDLGMVSRALKPEESDLQAHTIAWDGIAIIVHRSNTVAELTPEQIRGIYTGQISTWSEVGGGENSIVVVHKAQGRSTLELFLEHFGLRAEAVKADSIIGDNQQGVKLVSGNPAAIGYVSIGAAEYEMEHSGLIRALPLNGIASTSVNVKNGTYPLRRPLNVVDTGEPPLHVAEFLKFVKSSEITDLIKDLYFVPVAD